MNVSVTPNAAKATLPPMLADIFRQPSVLAQVVTRRHDIEHFAQMSLLPKESGQCVVFGSGDGWFAARAALSGSVYGEARSGLDFSLNVAPKLGTSDRVVAISMSGNVDRTLEGATLAQQRGAGLSILTNGTGGRLGALGGNLYSLDIAEVAPFLCGTSSYVATLATLKLGFAELAGDDCYSNALGELVEFLPEMIERTDRFARAIAERAGAPAGIRILGVGESVATADYGAAKFVEVTKIPAWSDDIEEFAHRQYWAMGRQEIVVLLPVDAVSASYADASAEALSDLGVTTIALEPEGALVPHAKERLTLAGGIRTAAITQAIGLQLLAYHLGIASGTDPNRRLHLKEDTQKFAVSRKLTRRSLLGTGQ